MKKIAVYARVSTDHEDQKNSVENQELYFKDYISKENGWQLYKMYADEGIFGTSLKHREQFNRMIEDARQGKFDIILTKEVCRFARNTLDTIEKTRELKKLGVEVRFLIDNISTFDSDGELRLTIMAGLAQDESRRTSERVRFGVIQQMKNGVAFGNMMYGYEFKKEKLVELYLNDSISKEMFDEKDKKLKEQLEITEQIQQKDLLKTQILEDKETITDSAINSIKQILEYKNITTDVFRRIIDKVVVYDKTHINIFFNGFKDLQYINLKDSIVGCYH